MKKLLISFFALTLSVSGFAQQFNIDKDSIMGWQFNENDSVFLQVEVSPQFTGGEKARMEYLMEKISIPFNRDYGHRHSYDVVQGTVYVFFIVERDGSISDVEIRRTIGNGVYDKLVIQAMQEMPKWIPGQQDGKPVRVRFGMPIRITLWN